MFGYIVPDKPDLRVRDYETWRAAYCGLCDALRKFGFGAKFLLNYDFVFVVLLHLSIGNAQPTFRSGRCNTNPLQRERFLPASPVLEYAAASLLLSSRYHLLDDRQDEGFLKRIGAGLALLLLKRVFRKAQNALPETDAHLRLCMARQAEAERQNCSSVDRACDATAQALAHIFENIGEHPETRRILRHLGYLIGRFVYLADAADDLASDLARARYNVFASKNHLTSRDNILPSLEEARDALRLTCAEIEKSYRLLHLTGFLPILDNIIYRGIPVVLQRVCQAKERNPL